MGKSQSKIANDAPVDVLDASKAEEARESQNEVRIIVNDGSRIVDWCTMPLPHESKKIVSESSAENVPKTSKRKSTLAWATRYEESIVSPAVEAKEEAPSKRMTLSKNISDITDAIEETQKIGEIIIHHPPASNKSMAASIKSKYNLDKPVAPRASISSSRVDKIMKCLSPEPGTKSTPTRINVRQPPRSTPRSTPTTRTPVRLTKTGSTPKVEQSTAKTQQVSKTPVQNTKPVRVSARSTASPATRVSAKTQNIRQGSVTPHKTQKKITEPETPTSKKSSGLAPNISSYGSPAIKSRTATPRSLSVHSQPTREKTPTTPTKVSTTAFYSPNSKLKIRGLQNSDTVKAHVVSHKNTVNVSSPAVSSVFSNQKKTATVFRVAKQAHDVASVSQAPKKIVASKQSQPVSKKPVLKQTGKSIPTVIPCSVVLHKIESIPLKAKVNIGVKRLQSKPPQSLPPHKNRKSLAGRTQHQPRPRRSGKGGR